MTRPAAHEDLLSKLTDRLRRDATVWPTELTSLPAKLTKLVEDEDCLRMELFVELVVEGVGDFL